MDVQQAYNIWAKQYDHDINKTRDLEAASIRQALAPYAFDHCLEVGCGTGKNTEWLIGKSQQITAVDLSEEMLQKARMKIRSPIVQFIQSDINEPWLFNDGTFDLVSFSLVLEHIE